MKVCLRVVWSKMKCITEYKILHFCANFTSAPNEKDWMLHEEEKYENKKQNWILEC